MKALRFVAQLALYAPLMAILAYFSTEPRFSVVAPGEALVRVSFIHATQRRQAARAPEELAKLAPNMRAALDCRASARRCWLKWSSTASSSCAARCSPRACAATATPWCTSAWRCRPAPPHRRAAARPAEGDFNFMKDETVELAGGQTLIIDFNAAKGGFAFLI